MQQEQRRRVLRPGFAVEEREAVHAHCMVRGVLDHGKLLRLRERMVGQHEHANQTEPGDPWGSM